MTTVPEGDPGGMALPPEPNPDTGPITRSPDLERLRSRRAKVPKWLRRSYDYAFVPAEVPEEYTEALDDVHARLSDGSATPDGPRILADAQAYFDEAAARIDSAERRATTLQGTIAIAATLVVGGAGLLLDTNKVPDQTWRIAFVLVLALFVVCLVGCAMRALGVTGRAFEYLMPGFSRIPDRAAKDGNDADVWRAAELLRAGGVASEIAAVKVGLLRSAAWWLRGALGMLAVLAVLLAVHGATTSRARDARPPQLTTPVTVTVPVQTITVPPAGPRDRSPAPHP